MGSTPEKPVVSLSQLRYVAYDQHLLFVEPSCKLAPSPQGSDPFPVSRTFRTPKKKAGIYFNGCVGTNKIPIVSRVSLESEGAK